MKQWIKDNSGLLVFLVLMAVSAAYAGRLICSDSVESRIAVASSSSQAHARTGRKVVIRRGEPGWIIGVCAHLSLAALYLGLFIAGVRDKFNGACVALLVVAFVLQIATFAFLANIAKMFQ